jgi:hypothetical protein
LQDESETRAHITENAFLRRITRRFLLTADNETVKEPYSKNQSLTIKCQEKRTYLQQTETK